MKQKEKAFLPDIFEMDISPYVSTKEFAPDEFIIREGERPLYLYYLVEGRAKLFLTQESGKISLINFIEAPCFIGGKELLQDAKFLRYLCTFLSEKATQNTNNYMRNLS